MTSARKVRSIRPSSSVFYSVSILTLFTLFCLCSVSSASASASWHPFPHLDTLLAKSL